MPKKNRLSTVLQLVCWLMCLCMLLTACGGTEPTEPSTSSSKQQQEDIIYSITLKTAGGMVLEGIDWYVYDQVVHTEVIDFGSLEKDGIITFTAPRSDKYILKLNGVPQGYNVQEYYTLTSPNMEIVLESGVITEGEITDRNLKLGDVVTDFTVTDSNGNQQKISEILKEKSAVVLNFWYINCGPCKQEFPYLQAAYDLYKDKLEVLAINAQPGETAEQVAVFQAENGYTFPMAKADAALAKAFGNIASPTTIIIDRHGVICLMETGAVVEEGIFEGAFNHFTAENYQQKLVNDIEELDTLEYPMGHKRNPMVTSGAVDQFQVTVGAGKAFYCNIQRCDGLFFELTDADISVDYKGQTYRANDDGLITFELSCPSTYESAQLVFNNETEEEKQFTVKLRIPPGTESTPIDLVFGENTVVVKQGKDMIHYTITADQTGFIKLAVTGLTGGEKYDIQITNNTTYRSILFQQEAVADADGHLTVAIPVTAGDEVRVVFMTEPDHTGSYPETTIQALVSFSEDGGVGVLEQLPYTLTFKDVEGLPMAGITATFTVNGEAVVLVSDETGVITTMLPLGSYMVQLVFPEGFTADATQYLLTPDNTEKEITVRLFEEKVITYIIHVQDQDGLPVANAWITVGVTYVKTDAEGNAVFQLPAGNYTATILPPEGYSIQQNSFSFGVRPQVTVEVENDQSINLIPYTVTVLNPNGDPYTGVMVRLYDAEGKAVLVPVSDDGVATTILNRGNYTVELLFELNNMRYEQTGLQLTAEITETTIIVAPGVTGKPVQVKPTTSESSYQAYYLPVGNTFVDLQTLAKTYFLFKPTQTGTYKISTDRAGAVVENWQTLDQTTPNTSGVENNVFTLEVTELGKTYVIALDAAYGVSNAIVTVFRVPDCILEEFPVTPDLPQLPFRPFLPSYGQLNYLDFTGMLTFALGADGYYHLDNEDGPVVLIDLRSNRFGVSIEKIVLSGEMATYVYDEDGYPIYKKDYTQAMKAYLDVMSQNHGLYPLTNDLYTILKAYGDDMGWWDPASENYLFGDLEEGLLIQDAAWMFLACYIYIDPELCPHSFTDWEISEDYAAMTRVCNHCHKKEIHVTGTDCNVDTAGQWELAAEGSAFISHCNICTRPMRHTIGTDCDDSSCGQWTLSSDGLQYTRRCRICMVTHYHVIDADCEDHYGPWILGEDGVTYTCACAICGHTQNHMVGTDCEGHYGNWMPGEDGLTFHGTCDICGNTQIHNIGTDCEEHYGAWTAGEDGLTYTRICDICGNVQNHTVETDCEDHYSAWSPCEDGVNEERVCGICGNKQTQPISAAEPDVPEEGTENPENSDENVDQM